MANIRTRRLRRWEIGCGLTAAALGTALHFACRWGGESRLLAVFAAANGSVWEQMKVLFFPLFLMALVEMVVFAQRYRNILAVKFVSVLFGVLLLPLLYYAYTGVWGGAGCGRTRPSSTSAPPPPNISAAACWSGDGWRAAAGRWRGSSGCGGWPSSSSISAAGRRRWPSFRSRRRGDSGPRGRAGRGIFPCPAIFLRFFPFGRVNLAEFR